MELQTETGKTLVRELADVMATATLDTRERKILINTMLELNNSIAAAEMPGSNTTQTGVDSNFDPLDNGNDV